jgi:outer membrane protein, adhesin transport system
MRRFMVREFLLKFCMISMSLSMGWSVCYAETLQSAVNQTLNDYPDILKAFADQTAAGYDIRQAQGGFLPSLDVEAGIGHENTDNPATRATGEGDVNFTRKESSIIIRQLVFDGGNVANQIRQSKADYRTRTFDVDATKQLIGYTAAEAYLNVLRSRELLTIEEYDVKANRDLYEKVAKRLKAGAGRKSELQLADSRLALAESQYDQAEGNLYSANDTYTKIIGSPPPTYLSLPKIPTNLPNSLYDAQRMAMLMSPTIQAADAQIAANQAAVGIAKSAYYPTVTVDMSQTFNDNLDGIQGYNNQREEMLRMRYNILNGGSDKAAINAANYRRNAAEHDAASIRRSVNEQVALTWNSLQSNLNRLPSLETHVTQSYNVWQAYEKQFQLGQRTLFDLLNAQSEYYNARASLTNAQYDVRIGRYQLLSVMGDFVQTVQRDQGIPDPYAKIWASSREFMGIKPVDPCLPKDTYVTRDLLAESENAKNNFTFSPASNSLRRGDVTGEAKINKREKVLEAAEAQYKNLNNPELGLPESQNELPQGAAPQGSQNQTAPVNNAADVPVLMNESLQDSRKTPAMKGQPVTPMSNTVPAPAVEPATSAPAVAPVPMMMTPPPPSSTSSPASATTARATPVAAPLTAVNAEIPVKNTGSTSASTSGNASTNAVEKKHGLFSLFKEKSKGEAPSIFSMKPSHESTLFVKNADSTSADTSAEHLASAEIAANKLPIDSSTVNPPKNSTEIRLSQAPVMLDIPEAEDIKTVNTLTSSHAIAQLPIEKKSHRVSKNYTIQLFAAHEKSSVEQLIKQLKLAKNTKVYHIAVDTQQWYVLSVGDYTSRQQAKKALQTFPKSIQKLHPMVKNTQHYYDFAVV